MLEAVTRWLLRDNSAATRLAEMAAKRLPAGARMRIKHDSGVELIESAMFIDGEQTLFAIATEPAERAVGADTSGYGVVMLNTGATSHIGPKPDVRRAGKKLGGSRICRPQTGLGRAWGQQHPDGRRGQSGLSARSVI